MNKIVFFYERFSDPHNERKQFYICLTEQLWSTYFYHYIKYKSYPKTNVILIIDPPEEQLWS